MKPRVWYCIPVGMLFAAAAAPVLSWVTQPTRANPTDPLKVGLLIQLSGAAGVYGSPSQQAAELAVSEINQAGGVLGRKLDLVIADDATDVKTAGEQARKLVNRDHVDVLISTESSAAREAVIPVAKRGNTLMIYTPLYEGGACDANLFDLGEVPQQQLAPVIPYMQAQYRGNTWYILGDDYNWPRALGKVTRSVVSAAGGSLAGEDYVPLGTSDFGATLDKIRSANADFVLMTLVGSDAIAFVKQLHDFGLGNKVKILGLALLDNTLPAIKGNTSNTFAAFGYFSTLNTPSNTTFLKALRTKFGDNAPQQTTLSEGDYDAIHLWAQAVQKAGNAETAAVVKAMGTQTFNGPRGTLTVSGTTHHVAQRIYLGSATPDATYEILHDFGLIEPGPQCSF